MEEEEEVPARTLFEQLLRSKGDTEERPSRYPPNNLRFRR